MFDIGFSELLLLAVLGLLVLGPERLPTVARRIGRYVGRARATWNQMRQELEREIDQSGAKDIHNEIKSTAAQFRDGLDESKRQLDETRREFDTPAQHMPPDQSSNIQAESEQGKQQR